MNIELTVPSKTFILGEYSALEGGPSLILNTPPRFLLKVEPHSTLQLSGISSESPAAKYMHYYANSFKDLKISFMDPFNGIGGFGASSAQFCTLAALHYHMQKKPLDLTQLVNDYQELSWNGQGFKPSGVDIISQVHGNITFFHKNEQQLKTLLWSFDDINFYLLHTNNKIPTHEHLMELKNLNFQSLQEIALQALEGLKTDNSQGFCNAINHYQKQLENLNLSCDHTRSLLKKIKQHPSVLAAKGCGAMGADVILVLVEKKMTTSFLKMIKNFPLKLINATNELSLGLSIRENVKPEKELIILVDENDQQIGLEEKLRAHQKGKLHRAFSIFVFRKNKNAVEVLLQQRSKKKYHTPGLWTNTCCSHPHAGENILECAQQRLKEEMGLNIPLQEVGLFQYKAAVGQDLIEHEMDHVFIGKHTGEIIHPNQMEVADYRWMEINQLLKDLNTNSQKYTPWLQQALEIAIDSDYFKKIF